MLHTVTAFLESYGYAVFFGVGFLEFIGAPFAGTAFLVAGGALAATAGSPSPWILIASAAAGGLLADAILFHLTLWGGRKAVDAACGLTPNPGACVHGVTRKLERFGGRYILPAKFIPGAAALIAPAAAMAGLPFRRFVVQDALALLLWAGVYISLGWIFSNSVEVALAWIMTYLKWVGPVFVLLVVASLIWRVRKYRKHAEGHAGMLETELTGESDSE